MWLRDTGSDHELASLRSVVRTFLNVEKANHGFYPQCNSWLEGHSPEFSAKLGARGWLGMTWPTKYGGQARSGLARFAALEELLAAGAPVAASLDC